MASLMNVEGFVSALTGGEEFEIDFPFDRLFRQIGAFLRLLLAAILIGAAFGGTPDACYPPGVKGFGADNEKTEELKADFVNAFCFTTARFFEARTGRSNSSAEISVSDRQNSRLYLFAFVPYALIVEGLLAYVPYLVYVGVAKAMVQPMMDEATDMAALTTGTFEERKGRSRGEEEDDTDQSEDERNYAKSMQTSMKKRFYAKVSLFISQRVKGVQGYSLVDHYHLCHVVVKSVVVVLQLAILGVVVAFSVPFPLRLSCPLPPELAADVGVDAVSCIFPRNRMALAFVAIDVVVTVALPIWTFRLYVDYWRRGFYIALYRAQRLVHRNARTRFHNFVVHMCSAAPPKEGKDAYLPNQDDDDDDDDSLSRRLPRDVDDIRFSLALLHANVDRFVANKIMTVYAARFDFERSDAASTETAPGDSGCGAAILRRMRPRLTLPKWARDEDDD